MVKQHIRLRGVSDPCKGKVWESATVLRVGRLESLEIPLDDGSVSRNHAEIRSTDRGWRVRDLGSTNGTRLNGVRLATGQWPLRVQDMLQFGEVTLVVEEVGDAPAEGLAKMRVEATASASWEEALEGLAFDSRRAPRPGEQLLALLRAGHHLVNLGNEEELLQSVLNDAVAVLDAQRGAIVLAEGADGALRLRALANGRGEPRARAAGRAEPSGRGCFSQSLAQRCTSRGESILCHSVADHPELAIAESIQQGAMASVLCVLLRTPRRRLGVIHLDRSPWQKPFTMDDLHLADALAANVSAGIESAMFLRKQRDQFFSTITLLADMVELRDTYTGGHTARVTRYSLLLGEHLQLPAAEIELIRTGGPLHDIGKIGIDDAILRKPDRLTEAEFEIMKQHTVKGAEILQSSPDLHAVIPIVRNHHERWDGKGYPDGLAGEAIPHLARIVAVADAFDAMTSDRPYRKGMHPDVAFGEVQKMSGTQFDPRCAKAFLELREVVAKEMGQPDLRATDARRDLL